MTQGFVPKGGVSLPQAFTKKSTKPVFQQQIDRLGTITGWEDVAKGIITVVEDDSNNILRVHVSEKDVARNLAKEKSRINPIVQKWAGYAIDSRMMESLPIGEKVILERCTTTQVIKKATGDVREVECTRVIHVTDPDLKKTFKGLLTISAYDGRVSNVQAWDEKALSIDDTYALTAFSDRLDEVHNAYLNKVSKPGLGVQFRTVVPKEVDANGMVTNWEVINMSPPFDWMKTQKDEAGNIVKEGAPITGDEFVENTFAYQDYIFGNAEENIPAYLTGDNLKLAKIEVLTYTSYFASLMSNRLVIIDQEWAPLNKMAYTPTKYSLESNESYSNKNWAVYGILMLSGDKLDKKSMTIISRDIATGVFANGYMGNLQNCIRTSDGTKAKVHPALNAVRPAKDDKKVSQATSEADAVIAPAQQVQPALVMEVVTPAVSASVVAEVTKMGDRDPFLDALTTAAVEAPVVQAAVEAPVVQATVEAPVATKRTFARN